MNAFLNFLEKFLTWFFTLAFGALLIYGGLRYRSHLDEESDQWRQARKKNTAEAYLSFLRDCHGCPEERAANKALNELQRTAGLLSRLSTDHLPERASIALPVFSPDGSVILATGGKGPDFWDVETGRRESHGDDTFVRRGGKALVSALDFAPDGRRIGSGMSATEGGRLMIWDLTAEALVAEHEVEASDVLGIRFSPDGVWLAWRGDGPVGLWNPLMGRFLRGTHAGITSMAFQTYPDGNVFLATAGGKDLYTWQLGTMELVRERKLDSDRPLLGLSHDGRVAVYSDGRVLELWDALTGKQLDSLRDLHGEIVSFCRQTNTGRIVVGTREGLIYLWDPLSSPLPLGHAAAHEGPVETLACGAESRIVSTGWDGAKVWNLEKIIRPDERPGSKRRP